MKQNKILNWIAEHKNQIGFVAGVTSFGTGMATLGFCGHKLYMTHKSIGKGGWVGFDLGEDTTVDIIDMYSVESMDIPVGHMVVDADYSLNNGFQTVNGAFDYIKLS